MSHICKSCGAQGRPAKKAPSSFIAEILVWIGALIVASFTHWLVMLGALAFSIWRFAGARRGCAKCGSAEVIPLDSPIGRQLQDVVAPTKPPPA